MSDILVPRPMTAAEVDDLLERTRAAMAEAGYRMTALVAPPKTVLSKDTARGRFAVGDRVRGTRAAGPRIAVGSLGTVVGFSHRRPYVVRVRIDGNRTASSWRMGCWVRSTEAPPAPAQAPRRGPRNVTIAVNMTGEEARAIKRAAKTGGISTSGLLYERVFGAGDVADALALLGNCASALYAASMAEDDDGVSAAQHALDDAALGYAAAVAKHRAERGIR